MRARGLSFLWLAWLVWIVAPLVAAACQPATFPARGVEARCVEACGARAHACGEGACARGCNLVMDRLAEGEGEGVVACVASAGGTDPCSDRAWARCAARVGPHADGGPPAPAPPSDDDPE